MIIVIVHSYAIFSAFHVCVLHVSNPPHQEPNCFAHYSSLIPALLIFSVVFPSHWVGDVADILPSLIYFINTRLATTAPSEYCRDILPNVPHYYF